ncbi:MAG: phosphatase PAP2 family protein [Bacteroidota bacterium]|nr:phosphatase PAP2 family protein [Bacteroidota bacterium]
MRNKLLKDNILLFSIYAVLFFCCLALLLCYSKVDISLIINGLNNRFLDYFFKFLTEFGTFTLISPIIILLAFLSFRRALTAISASILASLLTQVGKHLVWPNSPRPKMVFESLQNIHLHLVEGVRLHNAHSFPSGHTTGAFALFMVLALFSKKPSVKIGCLLLACLVGYSRLYLLQHFLTDVVAGSLIGIVSAVFCYWWFTSSFSNKAVWMDKSIRLPWKSSID